MKRATSKDVAKVAGVNQSTVSRVFSGVDGVGAATRKRILEVARQMNYTPNALARSMVQKRTRIVGIVMAGITSPFQSYVLEQLIAALHAAGRQALVFNASAGQAVDDVLPLALQYQVEALVITSAPLFSQQIEDCVKRVPLILFNRVMTGTRAYCIACDNVAGGRAAAEFLIAAGHTTFGYIAGNANTSTNQDREAGFMGALQARGFDCAHVQATYSYDDGRAAMNTLLKRKPHPSAVFCASDIIAMGAVDALRAKGERTVRNVAVVGFDDIPMASWEAYKLTTIREPIREMVAATVQVIEQLTDTRRLRGEVRLFAGELIERESARRQRR
jgi:DNA-binding LacI/PurR family transcriptional regulator